MSAERLSKKQRVEQLRSSLLADGATPRQAATTLSRQLGVNARVAWRMLRGWTQEEVAALYNQRWPDRPRTSKHVSYWECWRLGGGNSDSARAPSIEDLRRLGQLYGCGIDDLLAPEPGATRDPCDSIGTVWAAAHAGTPSYADEQGNDAVTIQVVTAEGKITVKLSRRQFTELFATGGLAAMIPGIPPAQATVRPAAGEAGVPAGEEPLSFFQRTLIGHQNGHHLLPPSDHIDALGRQLPVIDDVSSRYGSSKRAVLLGMKSQYAEHISWLHKEIGDVPGCVAWADHAGQWALEAGDYPMATYMMLRKANLALDAHHPASAFDLAQAALSAPWEIPAVLRALALTYQARGTAQSGSPIRQHVEEAAALASADRAPRPAYLRFFNTDFFDAQTATFWIEAGQPQHAINVLQSKIATLPEWRRRDEGTYLARLASAHTAAKTPDAAAVTAIKSLSIAQETGSVHTRAELEQLDKDLTAAWPGQRDVRRFHDALAAWC